VSWSGSKELVFAEYRSLVANYTPAAAVYKINIDSGRADLLFWHLGLSGEFDVVDRRLIFGAGLLLENLKEMEIVQQSVRQMLGWITRGNSSDRQPAYSPDGEWMIFSSNRAGNLDIWKISTKKSTTLRLTDDPAEDFDPAFTPDGKKILWSSTRSGHFEIWMANNDGSLPKQITQDGLDAENATMTKDGSWIVYNSNNPKKRGIWKIHPDGTGAKQLVSGATEIPEVSPDGQYALFNNPTKARLEVIRIADGQQIPFFITHGRRHWPEPSFGRSRWMPDGNAIVFEDKIPTGASLFLQKFIPGSDTNSTRTRLLETDDPNFYPESFGISPNGARITIAGVEVIASLMIADNVPLNSK